MDKSITLVFTDFLYNGEAYLSQPTLVEYLINISDECRANEITHVTNKINTPAYYNNDTFLPMQSLNKSFI